MPSPTAAVVASVVAELTAWETLGTGVDASSAEGAKIIHNQFNKRMELTATTAVPVSKAVSFRKTLTAGAATIDLTALTGANGATVNANGLKLQALLAVAVSGNTGAIVLESGSADGYNFMGAAWKISVFPGETGLPGFVLAHAAEDAPDVGGSAKIIDVSGTGSEAVDLTLVFG